MAKTSIEWTDESWNPVIGCRPVSPGCKHCYAQTMAARIVRMGGKASERYRLTVKHDAAGLPLPHWNGIFIEVPDALLIPLRTKKPTRWFVNSMSDLFGEGVSDEYIAAVFGVIANCPQHTFQILTKRYDRLPRWFAWLEEQQEHDGIWGVVLRALARAIGPDVAEKVIPDQSFEEEEQWPLPNAWIGVSVENQDEANNRIPALLQTPASIRFLSVEPLLGEVSLQAYYLQTIPGKEMRSYPFTMLEEEHRTKWIDLLDWVIVGGESGNDARPCDVHWIESIVEQCTAAKVSVFVKQLGAAPIERLKDVSQFALASPAPNLYDPRTLKLRDKKGGDPAEWPEALRVRQFPRVRP